VKTVLHDPSDGIYVATPDYVHAVEVRRPNRVLFVSGNSGAGYLAELLSHLS
jgi:hypothetical protein